MFDILEKLVAVDTTTAKDTLAAVEFVRDFLAARGAVVRLIYNIEKNRASLFATIGDVNVPGVVLSGHLDTVPTDEAGLCLRRDGGRLYGRGTVDMKGAISVALSLVDEMAASGKTFHFAFTHDEEIGSASIKELVGDAGVKKALANSIGCMVMEATRNKIVIGQKSAAHGRIEVDGVAAHSSDPSRGVNALRHAVNIYEIFYEVMDSVRGRTDPMFAVPHSVGDICQMSGGRAMNVIPDYAKIDYLCRFLDEEEQGRFFDALNARIENYPRGANGLSVRHVRGNTLPGFDTPADNPFAKKMLQIAPLADEPKVSYGTEAGYFSNMGIPVVVFGPGNIAQAHAADEFIEISELEIFRDMLRKLI